LPPWPGTLLAGLPGPDAAGLAAAFGGLLRGRRLAVGKQVAGYAWAGALTRARLSELHSKDLAGMLADADGSLVGRRRELAPLDLAAVAAWGHALRDPAEREAVLGQLGLPAGLPPLPAAALGTLARSRDVPVPWAWLAWDQLLRAEVPLTAQEIRQRLGLAD